MTAAGAQEDRDVVPRWRSFGATVRTGETAPLNGPNKPVSTVNLSEHEEAFSTWPGNHSASDLVGAALSAAQQSEVALNAASYLLNSPVASQNAIDTASSLLLQASEDLNPAIDQVDPEIDFTKIRARSHALRRIVRAEPRNAIRWADLALTHTVLGHPLQAEREVRTALSIAGPHRFLLRAAVRLYVHMEMPDKAHDLLVADPAVLDDPWLAAAELSTASLAGTVSKYTKRARRLLADPRRFGPRHVAELASQLATDELRAGNTKQAKRLMRLALIEPTDNAIAQAEWASANGLGIEPIDLDVPRTYEARALRHVHDGDWHAASRAGLDWLADQPFAQEAAQFTSYVASVGAEDWILAEKAARTGLVANPLDNMLRNNLIFAVANQGRTSDAVVELRRIVGQSTDVRERAVLDATRGLVLFRTGDAAAGRFLYKQAVETFIGERDKDSAALAHVFWAREEMIARTTEAIPVMSAALDLVDKSGAPVALLWKERLAKLVGR